MISCARCVNCPAVRFSTLRCRRPWILLSRTARASLVPGYATIGSPIPAGRISCRHRSTDLFSPVSTDLSSLSAVPTRYRRTGTRPGWRSRRLRTDHRRGRGPEAPSGPAPHRSGQSRARGDAALIQDRNRVSRRAQVLPRLPLARGRAASIWVRACRLAASAWAWQRVGSAWPRHGPPAIQSLPSAASRACHVIQQVRRDPGILG